MFYIIQYTYTSAEWPKALFDPRIDSTELNIVTCDGQYCVLHKKGGPRLRIHFYPALVKAYFLVLIHTVCFT